MIKNFKYCVILRLSIIIVNYNVKYFLEQCLYSVQKACENIHAEIWVADNCSTDGSKEYLHNRFPDVNFIWNDINLGFAKANNLALAKTTGDYILFLNPDTIIAEDCLEKCIQFLETHPQAGALGIRMIDGAGSFLKESKRAFPSPFVSVCKLSGLTALFPTSRIFAKYYVGHLSEKENHEVDVLAGAFMIIPKVILDKVGSFDETFFMYGEDVDLSYRIQKAGYQNYYFAESTIIHFKGESTRKKDFKYVKMFYNAMILFVKKHYSGTRLSVFAILLRLAILVRGAISVIGNCIKYLYKSLLQIVKLLFIKLKLLPLINKKNDQIFIVAHGVNCDKIKLLLKSAGLEEEVFGSLEKEQVANKLQLIAAISKYPITEIIFCNDVCNYKEIINLTQLLPQKIRYKFHAAGSNSIVGSDSSNTSGEFIAQDIA